MMSATSSKRRRGDGGVETAGSGEAALIVAPASSDPYSSAAGVSPTALQRPPLSMLEDGDPTTLTLRRPALPAAPAPLPHTPSAIEFAGEFENDWTLGEQLGRGTFSVVYRCTRRDGSGESAAVKIIDTRRFRLSSAFRATSVLDEVCILRSLDHPHIMRVGDVYDGLFNGHEAIFIVSELAMGGELFDSIIKAGNFSEAQARHVAWQVLDALAYMHGRGVLHRDLKPENLLVFSTTYVPAEDPVVRRHMPLPQQHQQQQGQIALSSAAGGGGAHRVPMLNIKLADFGVARYVGEAAAASGATTFVGSPQYVAPEVLFARDAAQANRGGGGSGDDDRRAASYGKAVDVYSLGVILYVCLAGYLPFDDAAPKPPEAAAAEAAAARASGAPRGSRPDTWEDRVRSGRFYFAPPVWTHISEGAKDLIRSMMAVDPASRISVEKAMAHPWFTPVREALAGDLGRAHAAGPYPLPLSLLPPSSGWTLASMTTRRCPRWSTARSGSSPALQRLLTARRQSAPEPD